jgi:hypothetical protein
MQTFLPFPDFSASARVLDSPRLGKQRVEALQVQRAIVLPAYGWQNHPAMRMWRGYIPALTRYALAMVDEWTARGHADSTRSLIAEFDPGAESDDTPALPSWLGDEALHLSHRSNLVRKAPEIYAEIFPGVPPDLPYVWPGPDAATDDARSTLRASTPPTWILRPRDSAQFDEWMTRGSVSLGASSPRGTRGPKWESQLEAFAALEPGAEVAVLTMAADTLVRGTVSGPLGITDDAGGPTLRLPVELGEEIPRRAFPYPALLQDPRTLFAV